jgi:2-polyprenyl-3-methyl-5-hydroxy-6-metoxy-1,4-benzoquinol methylase
MTREQIKEFYSHGMESNRLETEEFKLEGLRTKEIIGRYLTENNLNILDIGGGAGYYSYWLAGKGHQVSLVDLSPGNIELVRKHAKNSGISLKKFETGDAVSLNFPDGQFDVVLLMGPLYHLIDRAERVRALSEARRVLKPNGILLAAIISRYASLIDGFQRDLVIDDRFYELLLQDLKTGTHLNETGNLTYFTTSYFHTPNEIISEIAESGLSLERLIPVECFGWIVQNLGEKEKDNAYMTKLLDTIRMVEGNDDLLPISPHTIAIARKK